jgi:hypothetical protein
MCQYHIHGVYMACISMIGDYEIVPNQCLEVSCRLHMVILEPDFHIWSPMVFTLSIGTSNYMSHVSALQQTSCLFKFQNFISYHRLISHSWLINPKKAKPNFFGNRLVENYIQLCWNNSILLNLLVWWKFHIYSKLTRWI